jgi:nucleotide-binding universal stress UspA family protein
MIKDKSGVEVTSLCKAGEGVKSVREEILNEAPNHDLVVCGSRGVSAMERVRMGHVSLAVKENADTNVLIVR